jgi:hypothetical protein
MSANQGQARQPRGTAVQVDMLRAKAATLFATGLSNAEVAAAMGITERAARGYKEDVRPRLAAMADDKIDAIAEGAAKAREVLAECAKGAAETLGLVQAGRLPVGGAEDQEGLFEQEPQMIAQRRMAARDILTFVLGAKINVANTDVSDEKLARLASLILLEHDSDASEEP